MLMSRNNVHEVGQLDPEDVAEVEKFGPSILVKVEDISARKKGIVASLRHLIAK